jgi:hypothetical protein
MFADLPPSSMVVFFSVSAELRTMPLPTAVEPVKAILFMAGCSTS